MHQLTRHKMISWIEDHPYRFYGHYNDELSGAQIDLILSGEIDRFYESWWETECSYGEHANFEDIEVDFAKQFHLHSPKSDWPEEISELFDAHKYYCTQDVLETALKNSRPKVAVKPIKQSGNMVEFPHSYFNPDYNRYLVRYNKWKFGIDNAWDAETCYIYDVMTLLGRVDLSDWLKRGRAPDFINIRQEDKIITHNYYNGSGGFSDIEINIPRKMRAEFRNDDTDPHGVDRVFEFVGSVWSTDLDCVWA